MNLLSNIILFFAAAAAIAATAVAYSYILTQPGEIFGTLYGKLADFFNTDHREQHGLGKHPIFKMIMACEKCVAGQMAFWSFLIFNFRHYWSGHLQLIIVHLLFAGLTIFITPFLKKLYITYVEN